MSFVQLTVCTCFSLMLSSASVSRWVRNNQLIHQLVNQQKVTSATIAASHSLVAALSPFTEKTISRLYDNTTGCQSVLLELHLHIRTAPVMIPSVSSWHIAHILYILSTHQCDLDVAWCVYMQSFWKEPCLLFWLHDFIHLFKVLCKHFSAFNSNVRTLKNAKFLVFEKVFMHWFYV